MLLLKKLLETWLGCRRGNVMSEFKALDGGKPFIQPESPFLLLAEDVDGNISYRWWNNEKDIQEDAVERRKFGDRIICAIEISSCRDVEIP